jgi:hypothetical protein
MNEKKIPSQCGEEKEKKELNNNKSKKKCKFKDIVDIILAIVTIGAIFTGGFWTYNLFIKERKGYPHANIKHIVSHVSLSDNINLLRVAIELTNTGSFKVDIIKTIVRIQQILPKLPCVKDYPCAKTQVSEALKEIARKEDRFSWPMIAKRLRNSNIPIEIEPGEKHDIDFEFAIPSVVTNVRIYSYFKNETKKAEKKEIGWSMSSYYDLKKEKAKK